MAGLVLPILMRMSLADYINEKPIIKAERLTLRPLTLADVPALCEWTTDSSMYTYWGKRAGKNDLHPELRFSSPGKPSKAFHLGIVCDADRKAIGEIWVYLIENDRMAKIAFRISPAYQGKGYASEALDAMVRFCFTETELKRLWTDVDTRNIASVRVLEKCGFTREGLIRQGKMVSTWCDYYIYGLLRTDITE